MNIYTSTDFRGHWPVGVAAIIVAKDKRQGVRLLEADLKKRGLEQKVSAKDLVLISTDLPQVLVLNDGEY